MRAGVELVAAAGATGGAGLALRLANEPAVTLVLLYGTLRAQRAHARDQKVTEASPATSAGGGGFRSLARRQLRRANERTERGRRKRSSRGVGRCRRRGRGSVDGGESTVKILGGRRGGKHRGSVPGLFWSRETTRRTREDRRSSRACRRGFGMAGGREGARRRRRLRSGE